MAKRVSLFLLFFILISNLVYPESIPSSQSEEITNIDPIKTNDRILILAPHPDDETIGCAGVIQKAVAAKAEVKVVYFTNGDHNQAAFIVYEKRLTFRKGEFIHMGEVRRKEAIKAMGLLGVNEKNLIFLGYPDFGTFAIFSQYWGEGEPFRSLLTRISAVPYKENLSFQAPYKGESILNDLKNMLLAYKPNKIFVSHPADTNVDHKSLYLFLQIALCDLNKVIPKPKVYPYLIHCVGWPLPRHYHPQLVLSPPQQFLDSQINWSKLELTPEQLNKKHQAILCYRSQTESSAFYLLSFARKNELFGDYPEIELIPPQGASTVGQKQRVSIISKVVSFFGFSNMFTDSDIGAAVDLDNLIEGKGQVSYALTQDYLLARIHKTKKLDRRFSIMLYLFGYNHKIPFNQMPKIRIITRHNRFKVFDARRMIKPQGISIELNTKELILKVPLQILGEPEFILTSVKTHAAILSFDATSFRKIDIR